MSLERCPNPARWKIFYADEDPGVYGLVCHDCLLRMTYEEERELAGNEMFKGDRQCGQFAPIVLTEGAKR